MPSRERSAGPWRAMLQPAGNVNRSRKMNKFFSDLGSAIDWIWMTPEEARRLLRQRDLAAPDREEQGDYATAA
jgi:hypothetical protein